MAEPVGYAVLQPDPRGPGKPGELCAKAGLIHQRLQLSGGNRGPELSGWQRISTCWPGREQPPGRLLAETEREQQPPPPGYDAGGVIGEITIQLGVGQDDLNGVLVSRPADAGLGAHRTGGAIAAGHETDEDLLGPGR